MHLSLLVERFVLIRGRNKDKPWFNGDCRRTFDLKLEAHLWWTRDRSRVNCDEFVHDQTRADEVNVEAGCQFTVRSLDVLVNAQCPHEGWATLKSAVFGTSSDSSLPPLIGADGGDHIYRSPVNMIFGIRFAISISFVLNSLKRLIHFSVGQSEGRYTLIITIFRFFMCMSWYSTYELDFLISCSASTASVAFL